MEIWFGIANGQITSIFDNSLSATRPYFHFRPITSKFQWIFTIPGMSIDIVEIWIGIANGQISIFDRVICPQHVHIFVSGL